MPEEKNAAAVALGSIKTAKKTEASRTTIVEARKHIKPGAPCACGSDPHKYDCPGYRRAAVAKWRAKTREKNPGE